MNAAAPGPAGWERPEVSFVIPTWNEEDNVREICAAVQAEAEAHTRSWEIIVIDNDSTDRTRAYLRALCAADPRIRAIFNNRNYGQMRSPTHALYTAQGEAVIGLCADFQDPPALIGEMIRLWRGGAQIVFGQRRSEPASWWVSQTRHWGYRVLDRLADYPLIRGATGFGLYAREALDELALWNEPEPFVRGMVIEAGFRIAVIPFDRPVRAAGTSKNNWKTLFDFAISGLSGSSRGLLRTAFPLALWAMLASVALGIGTVARGVVGADVWPLVLLTAMTAMFGVMMLFVALIGDQVRMIAERTRNVPLVIEEERLNFDPAYPRRRRR